LMSGGIGGEIPPDSRSASTMGGRGSYSRMYPFEDGWLYTNASWRTLPLMNANENLEVRRTNDEPRLYLHVLGGLR